jgi:outer membrane protein
MKRFMLIFVPFLLYGQTLDSLIGDFKQNNDLLKAKEYLSVSKKLELESAKGGYYPTVDIGGYYQSLNQRTSMMAGDVSSAYAKISYELYDGGKRYANTNQKQSEYKSTNLEIDHFKDSMVLQIIKEFFTIKTLEANLIALNEQKESLQHQLQRVQSFYDASMATSDEVDKIQAAYDLNEYSIESTKYNIASHKSMLELIVGKEIENIENSIFSKKDDLDFIQNKEILSLKEKANSLQYLASSINSAKMPQLKLENSYNMYDYDRYDATHPKGVDNQNKLMITLNMKVFDGGITSNSKESILQSKLSLNKQIEYQIKEQEQNFNLAKMMINSQQIKIQSAKSALNASQSAYSLIKEKFEAGIVDNVAYLDALSQLTSSKANYESALYELESAYGLYYFYSGHNIEEFVK